MTDKEKIRKEVEKIARSINPYIPDEEGKNSEYEAGRFAMATQIMQIIDSLQEEPVSEELEQAAEEYEEKGKIDSVISRKRDFINGANWKEEQITKDNMLLPFKEYDNLMESVNKQKKEGYESGYKKGLKDFKEDFIKRVHSWLEDNFYYPDTVEEKYDFINDLCKALESDADDIVK